MKELEWYYPQTLAAASELIEREKIFPCAGGTFIIRTGMKNYEGLVDLRKLELNYITDNNDYVEIGAMTTFSDVADFFEDKNPEHILAKSLSAAATTPLRNRITIGGSVAAFPQWSDLLGPLLALDTDVKIYTQTETITVPIAEYITNAKKYRKKLITSIIIPNKDWNSHYFRATRTKTDHCAFNLTLLWKKAQDKIEDVRIVVVGNHKRFSRLFAVEEKIRGQSAEKISPADIVRDVDVEFADKKLGRGEFLKKLFIVELERGIQKITTAG
ncbi:FAD binding domain-containing protein [bacterium]|nr:FAD binding domain-containing protein [bacterium]